MKEILFSKHVLMGNIRSIMHNTSIENSGEWFPKIKRKKSQIQDFATTSEVSSQNLSSCYL